MLQTTLPGYCQSSIGLSYLRNSEGRFPEKWKSIFTFIGLAPSFESTVDLLTTVETDISFPNLVDMLKSKEQSTKSTKIAKPFQGTPLIAGANVHTTRETFKGGKNYNKGQQCSRNPSNSESKLRSAGKSNVNCYYCGHKGHIESECRTKQLATNAKLKVQSCDHQANVHASLGTEVLCMQSLSAGMQSSKDTLNKKMNTRWYLDSGASDHMANNREQDCQS